MIPSTLGKCVDMLLELRHKKQELTKQIEAIQEQARAIEEHLIQEIPKDDASGVVGLRAKATIKTKPVPTVKDWNALYAYIYENKDFSFLQRRVSDSAVKDRWEAGEQVPGVEVFNVVSVSVVKT